MDKDSNTEKGMTKGIYDKFNHISVSAYWSKIIVCMLSKDKRLNERAYFHFVESHINALCDQREQIRELIKNYDFSEDGKGMMGLLKEFDEMIK